MMLPLAEVSPERDPQIRAALQLLE